MRVSRPSPDRLIALKTVAVLLVAGVLVVTTQFSFMGRRVGSDDVGWALSIALVHGVALGLILASLILFPIVSQRRDARAARVEPKIRVAMAGWVAGGEDIGELTRLFRQYPHKVDECFRDQLHSIKGPGRRRLSKLATETGLFKFWKRRYRRGTAEARVQAVRCLGYATFSTGQAFLVNAMADSDPEVAVEAARTLADIGDPSDAKRVYDFAQNCSQLVCALLAEDLRPQIESLRKLAIAADLNSGDDNRISHALRMLEAWSVPLSVPMEEILAHPNRSLRIRGLRLLTPATPETGLENLLRLNLQDEDEDVVEAAIAAVGRLRIESLTSTLTSLMDAASGSVCRAAACALVQLNALEPLVTKIRTGGSPGAESAVEALEIVRMRRRAYSEA